MYMKQGDGKIWMESNLVLFTIVPAMASGGFFNKLDLFLGLHSYHKWIRLTPTPVITRAVFSLKV